MALLPLVFLDGKELFDADKRLWVALAAPTAFAFALLVLPTSETLDDSAPLVLWVTVFAGFCLVVAAVWLSFRILDSRDAASGADLPGDPQEGTTVGTARPSDARH